MIKGLFSLLLVSFFLNISAQKVVVSGKTKLSKNYSKFKVLGKLGDQYLVERNGKNGSIIDLYDSNLNLRQSKNINLSKRQSLVKIWVQPTSGWLITREDEKNQSVLKAAKLDKKISYSQTPLVLDSIPERSDLIANNLRVDFSLNESHMAMYMPIFQQGKIDYFLFMVYDTNMKLVQKKKITDDILNTQKFFSVSILNDGSFVLVLERERIGDENNLFTVFYGNPEQSVRKYTYTTQEPVFRKIKFEVDNIKNDLMVAGMYEFKADKRNNGGAYKFFTERINLSNGEAYNHVSNTFSNDFYRDLTGKDSPDQVVQFFTFYVNKIIPKVDGGMTVLSESYYKNEEERIMAPSPMMYGPSFGTFVSIITHNFNDIVVFDFDNNSQISRVQIVRKRQVSENDNGSYSSFFTFNERDKIRLFFLDEISRQTNFSEFAFSSSEVGKKRSLYNCAEKDVFPIAKMAVQTGVNELVLPSFANNQFSLVKINF